MKPRRKLRHILAIIVMVAAVGVFLGPAEGAGAFVPLDSPMIAPPPGAGPDAALNGTEIKDNPSGLNVQYTDYQFTAAPGAYQQMYVHIPYHPEINCHTQGQLGMMFNAGFTHLQQMDGSACKWGGVHMIMYTTSPQGVHTVVDVYYGDYCVGSTKTTNVTNCTQLSDGSIWHQRPMGPGWTDALLHADFITCAFGQGLTPANDVWQCDHYEWNIAF